MMKAGRSLQSLPHDSEVDKVRIPYQIYLGEE